MEELINQNPQGYNPANYERATLEEYGYKPHKALNMTWKIVEKVLIVFTVFMLYFAVIIIAIQSFNSSDSTTEFAGFTFDNYINMFGKKSLNETGHCWRRRLQRCELLPLSLPSSEHCSLQASVECSITGPSPGVITPCISCFCHLSSA